MSVIWRYASLSEGGVSPRMRRLASEALMDVGRQRIFEIGHRAVEANAAVKKGSTPSSGSPGLIKYDSSPSCSTSHKPRVPIFMRHLSLLFQDESLEKNPAVAAALHDVTPSGRLKDTGTFLGTVASSWYAQRYAGYAPAEPLGVVLQHALDAENKALREREEQVLKHKEGRDKKMAGGESANQGPEGKFSEELTVSPLQEPFPVLLKRKSGRGKRRGKVLYEKVLVDADGAELQKDDQKRSRFKRMGILKYHAPARPAVNRFQREDIRKYDYVEHGHDISLKEKSARVKAARANQCTGTGEANEASVQKLQETGQSRSISSAKGLLKKERKDSAETQDAGATSEKRGVDGTPQAAEPKPHDEEREKRREGDTTRETKSPPMREMGQIPKIQDMGTPSKSSEVDGKPRNPGAKVPNQEKKGQQGPTIRRMKAPSKSYLRRKNTQEITAARGRVKTWDGSDIP